MSNEDQIGLLLNQQNGCKILVRRYSQDRQRRHKTRHEESLDFQFSKSWFKNNKI